MTILVRIALMIVAYVLACVAASIVLTVGTLTPEWDDLASLGFGGAAPGGWGGQRHERDT